MSSYTSPVQHLDLLTLLAQVGSVKKIVEFGILNGHSLRAFIRGCHTEYQIQAFDIFDEFNGNHARNEIADEFSSDTAVDIQYGDYYNKVDSFDDGSIDLLHIDIANNGDVYEYCIKNYWKKIKVGGVVVLEGGSEERDKVAWMLKYNKRPIHPYVCYLKTKLDMDVKIYGVMPSLTVIKKLS